MSTHFVCPLSALSAVLLSSMVHVSRALAVDTNATNDAEANYARTISQRAEKMVSPLEIQDSAKSNRVHALIVQQYRDLRKIHDARDEKIKAMKSQTNASKDAVAAAIKSVQEEAQAKLQPLHSGFVKKLSADLSSEQVDKVKDGMTYSVLPLTYGVYLKMYPGLTDEQKRKVNEWLIEAREIAMDGGTSDEKHAIFGKYKGKINNYLSAAGYDAKQAEQNLRKAGKTSPEPTK